MTISLLGAHAQGLPNSERHGVGVIAGRIVDRSSGTPIPDGSVFLIHQPIAEAGKVLQQVIADPAGRFVFTDLAGGSFSLLAQKTGYVRGEPGSAVEIDLPSAGRITNAVLRMTKGAVIAGRITDDLGDPIVGVEVRAHRRIFSAGHSGLDEGVSARTDDHGRYRVAHLAPGDYLVAVPAPH